jgi:hypothetical protein
MPEEAITDDAQERVASSMRMTIGDPAPIAIDIPSERTSVFVRQRMSPLCAEADQPAAAFFLRQPRRNAWLPGHDLDQMLANNENWF